MGIREQYEASEIDVERINRFARRVACEKGPFPGGQLILETRSWTMKEMRGQVDVQTEERYTYALTDAGELTKTCKSWTDCYGDGRYWEEGAYERTAPFATSDYLVFDFERYLKISGSITGDREPGRRVLFHAKGVGISKRLKKVLDGS